jgi:hypothetical protein
LIWTTLIYNRHFISVNKKNGNNTRKIYPTWTLKPIIISLISGFQHVFCVPFEYTGKRPTPIQFGVAWLANNGERDLFIGACNYKHRHNDCNWLLGAAAEEYSREVFCDAVMAIESSITCTPFICPLPS